VNSNVMIVYRYNEDYDTTTDSKVGVGRARETKTNPFKEYNDPSRKLKSK